MKLKDLLNEITISRGIEVEVVGDQIIVNGYDSLYSYTMAA